MSLKLLTKSVTEREATGRFRREARAAYALNHPNIRTVHEIGPDKGRHFISMELLDGESLVTLIARGCSK